MKKFQIKKIPDHFFPDRKNSRSKYSRWKFYGKILQNFVKMAKKVRKMVKKVK